MSNIKELITQFNKGVDDGTIRMEVGYDCGHAYNGWTGQLWDLLSGLAQEIGGEDEEEWEEVTNERLSEDDPGLLCVPELINTLIEEDGGKTPGNDMVVACDCGCYQDLEPEEYLQDFMDQVEATYGTDIDYARARYRFDLMKAHIQATKK